MEADRACGLFYVSERGQLIRHFNVTADPVVHGDARPVDGRELEKNRKEAIESVFLKSFKVNC
ncbi:hypothetical protein B5G50_07090 [Brevibacillus brevis]|nr:hypothetical protein B5G50_07090 [Brevibacillus brevis]